MYDEDGCHFRPLICLPNEKNYLPLEYGYLVGQIIEIKKHLPRSLKVVGIDAKKCCAKDYPPTSKIPLIAIDGIDINNGKQLSIYSPSYLQSINSSLNITLTIPYNKKTSTNDTLHTLHTIRQYIEYCYLFYNYTLYSKYTIKYKDLSLLRLLDTNNRDLLKLSSYLYSYTHVRKIEIDLPIMVVMKRYNYYKTEEIVNLFKEDAYYAMNIVMKYQLPYRIVVNCRWFSIQSFVQISNIDKYEKYLHNLLQTYPNKTHYTFPKNYSIAKQPNSQYKFKQYIMLTLLIILILIYTILKLFPVNPISPVQPTSSQYN